MSWIDIQMWKGKGKSEVIYQISRDSNPDIQKILEAEGIDLELCRKEKGHREELPVEN